MLSCCSVDMRLTRDGQNWHAVNWRDSGCGFITIGHKIGLVDFTPTLGGSGRVWVSQSCSPKMFLVQSEEASDGAGTCVSYQGATMMMMEGNHSKWLKVAETKKFTLMNSRMGFSPNFKYYQSVCTEAQVWL